jgi:dTDP-4-amino-4,6-dideoxygalactose transaminase
MVVEDCAQAHGARYKGRSVGTIGHVGAWSFCQDKIMTTGGEGGMVTTDAPALWSAMWSFKDHGKSYDAVHERQHPPGFRWLHESFGTNWRMLEVQAAIGRIQLARMDAWSKRRYDNAARLTEVCRTSSVVEVPEFRCAYHCGNRCADNIGCQHAHYKFYAFVRPEKLADGWTRDRIVEAVSARGVPCYQGTCSEVYLEKAFDGTTWRPIDRLPNAQSLGERSLMMLVHPTLTDSEMQKACDALASVLTEATR